VGPALAGSPVGAYPLILWSLDGVRIYCFEGAVITAGAAAQWLRDGLGIVPDLRDLEPLARSVPSSDGVWAVPSLQGLGTPHLDVNVRGLLGGLSRHTTRAHVARAILEGIAWRSAEALEGLLADCREPLRTLRVDGGAAANALLLELIADASGAVVERPEVLDSSVLGAAFLAGRAVGLWQDVEVAGAWKSGGRFEPRMGADERATLRERWQQRVRLVREAGR
jgi:glycerol kinase